MKRNRGFSFIERLVLGRPNAAAPTISAKAWRHSLKSGRRSSGAGDFFRCGLRKDPAGVALKGLKAPRARRAHDT